MAPAELPPNISAAYELYDADHLSAFVDMAIDLLETNISRPERVKLLILLANCVESRFDTVDYYHRARRELEILSALYPETPEQVMTELHIDIGKIAQIVDDEAEAAEAEAEALFDSQHKSIMATSLESAQEDEEDEEEEETHPGVKPQKLGEFSVRSIPSRVVCMW